jgi:hypothetical protein
MARSLASVVWRSSGAGHRTIRSIANELTLDVIQLHGDPTTKQIDRLRDDGRRAVWPVLRVEGTVLPSETLELARAAGTLVLDAKVMGQLGGTGVPLDWAGLAGALARMRAAVTELRLGHRRVAAGQRDARHQRAASGRCRRIFGVEQARVSETHVG